MSEIFSFCTKLLNSTFQASPQNITGDQDIDLLRGNYNNLKFPIIFKHRYGKNLQDILGTGYASLYLISENLKNLLESNHITGWKSYPIVLLDKTGQEIKGYHGLSIVGTCDPIDYSQSEIIEKRYVENGPIVKKYKGRKVTPHGDFDFFIPLETLGFYISEKLAQLIKNNKITNINLTNIKDCEIDCDIVDSN